MASKGIADKDRETPSSNYRYGTNLVKTEVGESENSFTSPTYKQKKQRKDVKEVKGLDNLPELKESENRSHDYHENDIDSQYVIDKLAVGTMESGRSQPSKHVLEECNQ